MSACRSGSRPSCSAVASSPRCRALMEGLSIQAVPAYSALMPTRASSSWHTRSAASRQACASDTRLPARCRSAASHSTSIAHGCPRSSEAISSRATVVAGAPSWYSSTAARACSADRCCGARLSSTAVRATGCSRPESSSPAASRAQAPRLIVASSSSSSRASREDSESASSTASAWASRIRTGRPRWMQLSTVSA